jgi:CheY-like chemotaxis protein
MATVLIVEDDDRVRLLAQSYLEEHGHRVLSAGTPGGAIAVLKKTDHVDVLFTDLDLKSEIAAGIDLAVDAKQLHPNLKVLYTTGRAITDGMKTRFVEGSAFLEKPYTTEQLATALLVHFRINHHR